MTSLFLRFVLLVSVLLPASAFAGYAQLAPPPAFQSVGGVSTMNVGTAANGARYAGGHVMATTSLNIGARTVTVPVAMRVAANAATFAVTRMNPWIAGLSLAATVIPMVVDWFTGSDLEVDPDGKIQVRGIPGETQPAGSGDYWVVDGGSVVRISSVPPPNFCGSVLGYAHCTTGQSTGLQVVCSSGIRSGCYSSAPDPSSPGTPARPATAADLAPLANSPINPQLMVDLGMPLPVDPAPVINPAVEPTGDVQIGPAGNPAPELQPQPLRFPVGDPVPIPNTNPQRYTQEWTEIVGSPSPTDPWRIDVRPVTTETTDPTPQPDPTPSPDPGTDPGTEPEGDFSDTGLPPVPVLYERQYPDGFSGIWQEKKQAMLSTPLASLASQLVPSFGDGGCPVWQVSLNVGIADYGVHDLSIPCQYWGYIRIILIVSSLFLARRLIFGG